MATIHHLQPGNLIYLVRGKDEGRAAWHYVLIDRLKLPLFRQHLKQGRIDVAQYGKILNSGWGESPPKKVVQAIESKYG